MKKITRSILVIGLIFSSCQKQPTLVRNYSQPISAEDPTGACGGSNVSYELGMSDASLIARIKTFPLYDPSKPIFLSPIVYDLSQVEESKSVQSPNPDYMDFPHGVHSTSDEWGWDYLYEMRELRSKHGAEGMQMFLDKYLQGDSTLGMKLNKNF
tara:strand:+ start:478 stop:942 length:465 start_codon:yes stop_codon:yes gene_type:complete